MNIMYLVVRGGLFGGSKIIMVVSKVVRKINIKSMYIK